MGYSNWSDDAYQARQQYRSTTQQSAFTYDDQVRQSGVVQVHDAMNPYGKIRESRDSDDHPDSLSIAVVFDVTGSMGNVPRVLQTKLGSLMRVLIQKGFVAHPQILFGAVGDANSDKVPLQIGQFESGLEMDEDLGKLFLEGGGGGQTHETYELGVYFIARHTIIDCFDKRGQKGYLFTIGDENFYPKIKAKQVKELIGDELKRDLSTKDLFEEVQQRYHHFHIIPTNTYHGNDTNIHDNWRKLLGERVLLLGDENAVCETIALTIGLCEGTVDSLDDGADELVDAGYDKQTTANAVSALSSYAATRPTPTRVVKGMLPPPAVMDDDGRL